MRNAFLIKPRISIVLFLFFAFVYLLSFFIAAVAHMPAWLHFLVGAFMVVHFVYVMRRYVFYRHPLSVKRLWCDDHDHWKMQYRDAHVRTATLLQSVMVSRYLVFLAFRVPGRFFPVAVPLAMDSEKSESMRRLRQALVSEDIDQDVEECESVL